MSLGHNGRMSRIISSRLVWLAAALAAVVTGSLFVQDVVAGPDDRDLGPIVENTHEPAPTPSTTPTETPSPSPEPTVEPSPEPEPAPTNHPVAPAPPVDVEYDDDWDDDDWDDDDDDDDDDDWDEDDWDDDDWDDDDDD